MRGVNSALQARCGAPPSSAVLTHFTHGGFYVALAPAPNHADAAEPDADCEYDRAANDDLDYRVDEFAADGPEPRRELPNSAPLRWSGQAPRCASNCLELAGPSREDTDDFRNVFRLSHPIER